MASKTERTVVNAAGLVQGIVLVKFPAESPVMDGVITRNEARRLQ
jgi:hypothetical protein